MLLLQAFSSLPIGTAKQMYDAANYEFPLLLPTLSGYEKINKNDPRYEELLETLPGTHIKAELQELLVRSGIRKDLIFCESPTHTFCAAWGTNYFTKSDASIDIAPGFYAIDKEACTFLIKHEICHIKNNDNVLLRCVPLVCMLAAGIYGICFLSFLPAILLANLVNIVFWSLSFQWGEGLADEFAIENSSDEELKGGRSFFLAAQAANIEMRTTFWNRIKYSASGDSRFDIGHPSLTSRIQKIELALQARGVHIDRDAENLKLNGELKNLIAQLVHRRAPV